MKDEDILEGMKIFLNEDILVPRSCAGITSDNIKYVKILIITQTPAEAFDTEAKSFFA